ncbi:MAG: hypothetical protein ABIJ12_10545 [bacterium]
METKQLEKDSIRNKDITDEFFISKQIVNPEVVINSQTNFEDELEPIPFDLKKENIISGKGIMAAASSLLLNLRLHNWLTGNEKDFLDNLATENDLVFLIKGDKYFHPEELELFQAETIQSCCNSKNDAVFSQKYTARNSEENRIYRIRTAFIDSIDGENLILGQFGLDLVSEKEEKDYRFHQLVELFRKSVKPAMQAAYVLEKKLEVENPIIIVNRASGYIVHANNAAGSLLSSNVRDLAGAEFSSTSAKMKSMIPHYKMNFENISSADMSFSIVKIVPTQKGQVTPVRKVFEEANAGMRGPISTIVTAASILEADSNTPESKKLIGVILDEIQDVDRRLKLQNLVAAFDELEKKETNLQYEAENAIDCFTTRKNYKGFIELQTEPKLPLVTAPEKSYMSLIYSILGSHTKASQNNGRTTVKIFNQKEMGKVIITISTKIQRKTNSTHLGHIDLSDTEKLAVKLDVSLKHDFNTNNNSIDTSITVNYREKAIYE